MGARVRLGKRRRERHPGRIRVLDHDRRGSLELRREAQGRIEVDQVVVRQLLSLELLRGRRRGERERLAVQGRLLIRILPVPEIRDLVVREAQRRRGAPPPAVRGGGEKRGGLAGGGPGRPPLPPPSGVFPPRAARPPPPGGPSRARPA